MGKINYDVYAAWLRIASEAQVLDPRAPMVLILHAALEREMDEVLRRLVVRFEPIAAIGWAKKNDLIHALWRGTEESGATLHKVLMRFNEFRNKIAHSNRDKIDEGARLLFDAAGAIQRSWKEIDPVLAIALDICAFIGDEANIPEIAADEPVLGKLLNEAWARTLKMNAR